VEKGGAEAFLGAGVGAGIDIQGADDKLGQFLSQDI
jgi:hypothetical protein